MALALVALSAMGAPRTTKKRHKKAQRVERVERYDSAYVTLYGETPEGIMREYVEKIQFLDTIYDTASAYAPVDFNIILDKKYVTWKWYYETWGDTLRQDPDVWKAFMFQGSVLRELTLGRF